MLTSISHDEIIREQSTEKHCLALRRRLDSNEDITFEFDQHGILIRVAPREFSRQVFIPQSMRERLMHLVHHSKPDDHTGGLRMCSTLRCYAYWPSMTVNVHNVVRNCMSCARQRIRLPQILFEVVPCHQTRWAGCYRPPRPTTSYPCRVRVNLVHD